MATRKRTNRKSRKRRKRGGVAIDPQVSNIKNMLHEGFTYNGNTHYFIIEKLNDIDSKIKELIQEYDTLGDNTFGSVMEYYVITRLIQENFISPIEKLSLPARPLPKIPPPVQYP